VVAAEGARSLGAGSVVTLTREEVRWNDQTRSRFSTITAANGGFSFNGIPAGTYLVCAARPETEDYVDYCAWTLTPPRVVLRAGTATANFRIALEKGVRVDVAVEDPDGVLRNYSAARKRALLKVHVTSNAVPPNAMQFSKATLGRMEYSLTVPRRAAMRVAAIIEEGADLARAGEPPGLAKRSEAEELVLPPGLERRAVVFRLHAKKK